MSAKGKLIIRGTEYSYKAGPTSHCKTTIFYIETGECSVRKKYFLFGNKVYTKKLKEAFRVPLDILSPYHFSEQVGNAINHALDNYLKVETRKSEILMGKIM